MKGQVNSPQGKCQNICINFLYYIINIEQPYSYVLYKTVVKYKTFGIPLSSNEHQQTVSDPFPVTNGVKQGCVLASTLFSMMFSAMLTDAFHDGDNGTPIRYRFDGKFFNLRRLQAKSKVQTEVLDQFLFADDMAKGAPTEEKIQKSVDQVFD